jgi:hypothetical protein
MAESQDRPARKVIQVRPDQQVRNPAGKLRPAIVARARGGRYRPAAVQRRSASQTSSAYRPLRAAAVIALGLSGAVAPLTTAVLSSIDARHTAAASGFNSAVARIGG